MKCTNQQLAGLGLLSGATIAIALLASTTGCRPVKEAEEYVYGME